MSAYSPFKKPFRYESGPQSIMDARDTLILDVRGWGYLTGRGSGGCAMDESAAAKTQDAIGRRVAELMNRDEA